MNMTKAIKEDLLPKMRERSARRQREGKTRMLDELCEDYGCERKYASKLLGDAVPPPGSPAANGWPRPAVAGCGRYWCGLSIASVVMSTTSRIKGVALSINVLFCRA